MGPRKGGEVALSVGERIKNLRNERNIKASHLAAAVGVSLSTLRDWENGRAILGEPYLKLAEALGVSISELFGMKAAPISSELDEIIQSTKNTLERAQRLKSRL